MRRVVQRALRRSIIGGVLILAAVVGCFLGVLELFLVTQGVESSKEIAVFLGVFFVAFLLFAAVVWVGNLRPDDVELPVLDQSEATELMRYRAPYWFVTGCLLLGLVMVSYLSMALGAMCLLMAVSMVLWFYWMQGMALYIRSV